MEQMINKNLLEQDELIERYLQNQMNADEETEFESRLRTDAVLRSRARFVAQTIKAMKSAEEKDLSISLSTEYRRVARNPLAKPKKK